MSVKSPECLRCCRDNKVPKLYSANNNMSPGFVPVELLVSLYITFFYNFGGISQITST